MEGVKDELAQQAVDRKVVNKRGVSAGPRRWFRGATAANAAAGQGQRAADAAIAIPRHDNGTSAAQVAALTAAAAHDARGGQYPAPDRPAHPGNL